jgi:hypothetical protein
MSFAIAHSLVFAQRQFRSGEIGRPCAAAFPKREVARGGSTTVVCSAMYSLTPQYRDIRFAATDPPPCDQTTRKNDHAVRSRYQTPSVLVVLTSKCQPAVFLRRALLVSIHQLHLIVLRQEFF